MMTTLRALVIAFSMYSQIPMPQFTWQDKEMDFMWMDLWIRWMRSILTSRERKNLRY